MWWKECLVSHWILTSCQPQRTGWRDQPAGECGVKTGWQCEWMLQASVPKFALHLCAKRFPAFQMIATNIIWIPCEERKWSSLKATLILTKFTNGQWASAVPDIQFNLMLTTHSLAQVGWNNLQELGGKTPKNWFDKKKKRKKCRKSKSPDHQMIRFPEETTHALC